MSENVPFKKTVLKDTCYFIGRYKFYLKVRILETIFFFSVSRYKARRKIMRVLVGLLFIFFSSIIFAFGTTEDTTTQTAAPNFKQAQELIDKKEYEKAIPVLNEVIIADPKNADALNYLGFSYRQMGKLDEALQNYLKALAIDPNHKGANEYLGELYLEKGDLPKAQERLMVLEKICPSDCIEHKTLKDKIDNFKQQGANKSAGSSDKETGKSAY